MQSPASGAIPPQGSGHGSGCPSLAAATDLAAAVPWFARAGGLPQQPAQGTECALAAPL